MVKRRKEKKAPATVRSVGKDGRGWVAARKSFRVVEVIESSHYRYNVAPLLSFALLMIYRKQINDLNSPNKLRKTPRTCAEEVGLYQEIPFATSSPRCLCMRLTSRIRNERGTRCNYSTASRLYSDRFAGNARTSLISLCDLRSFVSHHDYGERFFDSTSPPFNLLIR